MISFIVPAHNEAAEIGASLDALNAAAQAVGEPFELIVVDDASDDATAAIADARGAWIVRVEHRQIAATRNAGAAVSSGDTLVFVDADTHINATVLREALAALETGAVGGGAGIEVEGESQMTPRERRFMKLFLRLWRMTGYAAGCFFYCRRVDFEAVGGFDERYYASEEIHLSRALKRRGPFKVLKTPVLTSSRKWRLYSRKEQRQTMLRLLLGGFRATRKREGLDLWYDGRRETSDKES